MSKHIYHIHPEGNDIQEVIQSYIVAADSITNDLPAAAHKSLCTSFLAHYTFLRALREATQDQASLKTEIIYDELSSILQESGIIITSHKA